MDPTGLTNLEFLTNGNLTIVLLSDRHAAFDPFASNAIHHWINKNITKAPNSYILAESTSFSDVSFTFHILPMYFSKENVHFCDTVRFVFRLICETTGENATKVINFVNSLDARSNILEIMDLSNYKSTEPITKCNKHKFDFLTLANLIANAFVTKNMYNRIVGDHADINVFIMNDIINDIHRNKTINNIHQSVLKEIFAYELLLFHLIHINFMYRVINFIKPYKIEQTNEQLWQLVTNWLSTANNLVAVNNVIGSLARLLDYVIILKTIEIYENNNNALIWINAGNGHTIPISSFLKQLFNEINLPLASTAMTPDFIKSEAFTDLVKDPRYGLREPPKIDIPIVASSQTMDLSQMSKAALIRAIATSLYGQYKVDTAYITDIIAILNNPSIKAPSIIRIANLIETKGILRAFEETEFADVVAMTEDDVRNTKLAVRSFSGATIHFNDDNQYSYTPLIKLAFNKPFFAIHLPMFTPSEEAFIYDKNMTATKFIYDNKSVLFAKLLPDVDVLTVPPASNYTEEIILPTQYPVEYDSDYDEENVDEYHANYEYFIYKQKLQKIHDKTVADPETNKEIAADTYTSTLQELKRLAALNIGVPEIDTIYTAKYKSAVEVTLNSSPNAILGGCDIKFNVLTLILLAVLIVMVLYVICIVFRYTSKCFNQHKKLRVCIS